MKDGDFEAAAAILKKGSSGEPYCEGWGYGKALSRVKELFEISAEYCFVAENGKETIGIILCSAFTHDDGLRGFVDELWVLPEHQKKGVGTLLLAQAEKTFLKKGAKKLLLLSHTGTWPFDFYLAKGYTKDKYVLMEKTLKK